MQQAPFGDFESHDVLDVWDGQRFSTRRVTSPTKDAAIFALSLRPQE